MPDSMTTDRAKQIIRWLSYSVLRSFLTSSGISGKGRKADLIARAYELIDSGRFDDRLKRKLVLAYEDRRSPHERIPSVALRVTRSVTASLCVTSNSTQASLEENVQADLPGVTLKKLPFLEELGITMGRWALVPLSGTSAHTRIFTLSLTEDSVKCMVRSLHFRPVQKMRVVFLQARFCRGNPSTEPQPDCYPDSLSFRIDGRLVRLPPVPSIAKPGEIAARPSEPLDITGYVSLQGASENVVEIGWSGGSSDVYAVQIDLVRNSSPEDMVESMLFGLKISKDATKARITKLLDPNADVLLDSLRLSLKCPIGLMRIRVPVRAMTTCSSHVQCFDALCFFQLNKIRPSWRCPVCDEQVAFDDLAVDEYFVDVLASRFTEGVDQTTRYLQTNVIDVPVQNVCSVLADCGGEKLLANARNRNMALVPKSVWASWEKAGKEEFVKLCLDSSPVSKRDAADGFPCLVAELVESVAKNSVEVKSAAMVIRKIFGKKPALLYRFLDSVNGLDYLHPAPPDGSVDPIRTAFLSVLREIIPGFAGCENTVRVRLEAGLLHELGLVKNVQLLNSKMVKVKTKLYYKQHKYNMLREETEGFSKLLVHLTQDFSEMKPEDLKEITRGLIGHFNLDPNRVLQLMMMALEVRSADEHAVDVLFPVMREYAEAARATVIEMTGWSLKAKAEEGDEPGDRLLPFGRNQARDDDGDNADLSEEDEPPKSDKRTDKSSDGPSDSKRPRLAIDAVVGGSIKHPWTSGTVEEEFARYRLTALLLHYGLVDVDNVRPWLSPSAADMAKDSETKLNEAREILRKVHVVNTTGAGMDAPINHMEVTDLMDPYMERCSTNQWLGLIECLLDVGDWQCVKKILAGDELPKFFPAMYPPVAVSLCKEILRVIDPLYRAKSKSTVWTHGAPPDTRARITANSPRICEEFTDLAVDAFQMMITLGPYMYHDALLLCRVARVAKAYFEQFPPSEGPLEDTSLSDESSLAAGTAIDPRELQYLWYEVLQGCVLPALSLMECPSALAEEVWAVMNLVPFQIRFQMYDFWKNEVHKMHPILTEKRARITKSAKDLMKRLSKDSIKSSQRHFGKLMHANPGVVFDYVFRQVVIFDNLINPVVDAFKSLTNLGLDLFGFCVIEMLSDPRRVSEKHDGMNISTWMQNLCNFAGSMYRRYTIDLMPVLHYVANQLAENHSFDILLLKEIVGKMGGTEALQDRSMNMNQILAYGCGGDILRVEVLNAFSQIKTTRKSIARLKDALVKSGMTVPLFLACSQQRVSIIFSDASSDRPTHNKLVSQLYDQIQEIMAQFSTFLSVNMSADEYSKLLPPFDQVLALSSPAVDEIPAIEGVVIKEEPEELLEPIKVEDIEMEVVTESIVDTLCVTAGESEQSCPVDPEVAFTLYRPKIQHMVASKAQELAGPDKKKSAAFYEAWKSVMDDIEVDLLRTQPQSTWNNLSPALLATFWSLSLSDLRMPFDLYDAEVKKLQHEVESRRAQLEDREPRKESPTKIKKDIERAMHVIELLKEEKKKQTEHVERVREALRRDVDRFFDVPRKSAMASKSWNEMLVSFLQMCILPRVCNSVIDALFCAEFVQVLHEMRTPRFPTLIFIDRMMCDPQCAIASFTEDEANRYGKFLCQIMAMTMRWHSKKEAYPTEPAEWPGFLINAGKAQYCDYESYRHLCHKWEFKFGKGLISCLESKEYVHIRNALLVLIGVLPEFPMLSTVSGLIMKRVEKVIEAESKTRRDLGLLATSYKSHFNARQKTKPVVPEDEFHRKDLLKKSGSSASASPVARSSPSLAAIRSQGFLSTMLSPPTPTVSVKQSAKDKVAVKSVSKVTAPQKKDSSSPARKPAEPSSSRGDLRSSITNGSGEEDRAKSRKTNRADAKLDSGSPPPAKKEKRDKEKRKSDKDDAKKKEAKHKKDTKEDKALKAEKKLEKKAKRAAEAEANKSSDQESNSFKSTNPDSATKAPKSAVKESSARSAIKDKPRSASREKTAEREHRERGRDRDAPTKDNGSAKGKEPRGNNQAHDLSPVSSSSGCVSPAAPISPKPPVRRHSPITTRDGKADDRDTKRRPTEVPSKVQERSDRDRRDRDKKVAKRPADELEDGEYVGAGGDNRKRRVERPARNARVDRDPPPPVRQSGRDRERSPENWVERNGGSRYREDYEDHPFGPSERDRSPVRHVAPLDTRRRGDSERYSRRK